MHKKLLPALAATTFLFSSSAFAAGFYVQEVSSSAAGVANAGAAATPRDASVIFHNPSAMTKLDGAQVNGAVHALFTHAELEDEGSTVLGVPAASAGFADDGGNPGGLKPIPNLYGAMPLDDDGKYWVGIGVTAPWGLGPDYDDNFFGSRLVEEAELSVIDITPSFAYKVNDMISVGFSAIIQHAGLDYEFLDPVGNPTDIDADDTAFGYKLSATITPTDDLTFGLQYRSRTNLDFEGDISGGAILGIPTDGSPASGTLNLPDIATFGAAYDVNDRWTVMAGAEWFGWNHTDTATITPATGTPLPVLFEYENTLNFSLGVEHQYSDTWTLRAGYQYDETPTTIAGRSPLNPDANRHWFAGGATQTINEKWSLDYALTYIDIGDGNINRQLGSGNSVVGQSTDNYAVIGAFGVNYKF